MNRILNSRNGQIIAIISILMVILTARLFVLTVIENENWRAEASSLSVKSIYTPAPRGEILDRYGRVIAGNVQTFAIQVSSDGLENEEINHVSQKLMEILEKNGDAYNDNFPILIENGNFVYSFQKEIDDWLISQEIPLGSTAEEAFNELRERNSIDEYADKYEAQTILQSVHNIYPPVSVKNMKYTKDLDKESLLQSYYLDVELGPEEAFNSLRKHFKIEESLSPEEARKIMVIRNESAARGYRKYMPAKIASGISEKTIVEIEERSSELPGVSISSETIRNYPNGSAASHIVGYLGKISESDREKYVNELRYNPNDLIGQYGLENVYESTLKGQDGQKNVQVNAVGELVKVVSETPPQKGKDVHTTLDLELQKTAEAALKQTLSKIQTGGTFESVYGDIKLKQYKNANVGAIVAIEVETGDVLAMASAPDFDPNLFAKGISSANWATLQSQNPRDPMAPRPLYNVAAQSAVQPGSIFKMVTATAAMESGLDPKLKLYDGGRVIVGNRPYKCLIYGNTGGSHGKVNLETALECSCNYYFFDIATGRDLHKGKSLGYDEPINIDKISYYANEYGLGISTGIEITERVVPVPTKETKMQASKNILRNYLIGWSEEFFKPEVVKDKNLLNKNVEEIISWAEENPSRSEIMKRLKNVGIKDDKIEYVADQCRYTHFPYAQWTLGDELNISIGQGENSYTPLQIANYVATIGNDGIRNKVSLIHSIEGQGRIEKEPGTKIDISDDAYLDEIIKGMKAVTYGPRGSLKGPFVNFPVEVALKTGTAEKGGSINPPDEVEYVKKHLRRFNSKLSWAQVEKEMFRLMKLYPESYPTKDNAVRKAVINLSDGRVTSKTLDVYKENYDPFAWVVALAPADNPKIAISAMVVQGGSSTYLGPLVREVIGKYLQLDKIPEEINLETKAQ